MYDAIAVACYIILRCNQNQQAISNLKLQKILYFVQATFLVERRSPCFRQRIEAWDFGPVVPEVYRKFKGHGGGNISLFIDDIDTLGIGPNDANLIDRMVDTCAEHSASNLVEITHHQLPWMNAYEPGKNNVITNDSIFAYFSR